MAELLVLALLTGAAPAAAQAGTIHGQVTDTAGQVVQNAFIHVPGLGLSVVSDSSGLFRFDGVPIGSHLVQAQAIGFEDDSVRLVVVESGSMVLFRLRDAPPLWEVDTTPQPFVGGLRIGLYQRRPDRREQPHLFLRIETEHLFTVTGMVIDVVGSRSDARLGVEILGAHHPTGIGGAAMAPATFTHSLDLLEGGAPDTLEIEYQADSDRYLVWRTQGHVFIKPMETSFTTSPGDSLELANPGTVRIRCEPAGHPAGDCEEFMTDLSPLGARSDTLTPRRASLSMRVFGNTLNTAEPDARERWLIAHGLIESDIERVLARARTFTAARGGRAGAYVEVDTWDGRRIVCHGGECQPWG